MLHLPIVTIQPSFPSVIAEVHVGIIPSETFWISCYKTSEQSVHAKVHAELDEVDRDLVLLKDLGGDVDVKKDGVSSLQSSSSMRLTLNIPRTKVLLPMREYTDPSPHHVRCTPYL